MLSWHRYDSALGLTEILGLLMCLLETPWRSPCVATSGQTAIPLACLLSACMPASLSLPLSVLLGLLRYSPREPPAIVGSHEIGKVAPMDRSSPYVETVAQDYMSDPLTDALY